MRSEGRQEGGYGKTTTRLASHISPQGSGGDRRSSVALTTPMWIETPETPVSRRDFDVNTPYEEVRISEPDHPKPLLVTVGSP